MSIDRLERNRSRFIAQAVEHELARRRHEGLRRSWEQPHPEAAELADAGIGEWAASARGRRGARRHDGGHAGALGRGVVNLDRGSVVLVCLDPTATSNAVCGLTETSYALIDRLRSVDKRRICRLFGRVVAGAIDQGLELFLRLG